MKNYLIKKGYIPLDKSWIIRMGILDLLNGRKKDCLEFLERQEQLSDDLRILKQSLNNWDGDKIIYVGESGTLYRFLKFASWKLNLNKKFELKGTLKNRKICDNQEIINYPLEKLLKLDKGTSQWASAAVLLGNSEKIENIPYKLKLTYEAMEHWKKQRSEGRVWNPRYDETILRQAIAFLDLIHKGKAEFIPRQAEDYCFARAFGFITKEKGKFFWPSLQGHESNRLEEMEKIFYQAGQGLEVDSSDHRAIQAYAMLRKSEGKKINVKYPEVVNKSWPQFWKFLNDSPNILR